MTRLFNNINISIITFVVVTLALGRKGDGVVFGHVFLLVCLSARVAKNVLLRLTEEQI